MDGPKQPASISHLFKGGSPALSQHLVDVEEESIGFLVVELMKCDVLIFGKGDMGRGRQGGSDARRNR